MKRLLLSTAILGAATVPALAQDQSIFREAPEATELRASDFMGMRVYASETPVSGTELEGIQDGWEDIGEINDIVMDRDGQVQAVLVDIGGFLGIGERTVAVSMGSLQFVSDSATAENADDFFLVMNANRQALEAAPEYRTEQAEGMTADQAAQATDQAIEDGSGTVAAAGAAAGAAVGTAVQGAGNAGGQIADAAGDAVQATGNAVPNAGETVAGAAQGAVQATGNAVEGTSEEVARAAEAMTTTETATTGQTVAQGAAATDGQLTTADTQDDVIVSNVPAEDGATATDATQVANTEQTSAETVARTPIVREGFVALGAEDMTADLLQGAAVYDANDERVGEVGEILLSADGRVDQLVVDIGGFLGLGEKPVALPMASLDLLRQDGGEEIRVYVSQTEEELEAMERYAAQ